MKWLLADIETTPQSPGKIPDTIHCMAFQNSEGLRDHVVGHVNILDWWLEFLARPDAMDWVLVGHNWASFDVQVLEHHLASRLKAKRHERARSERLILLPPSEAIVNIYDLEMYDTLVASQMIHGTTLVKRTAQYRNSLSRDPDQRERMFPARFMKKHSLESWGYRFGQRKKHVDVDVEFFEEFSEELLERCVADVALNVKLFNFLLKTPARPGWPVPSAEVVQWESRIAYLIGKQRLHGFGLDEAYLPELEQILRARLVPVAQRLQEACGGWLLPRSGQKVEEYGAIKRRRGEAKFSVTKLQNRKPSTTLHPHPWPAHVGGAHTKIGWVDFNPNSDQHRIRFLKRKYGWQHDPEAVTPEGQPQIGEEVMIELDYPEIPDLVEYVKTIKKLGMAFDGPGSWTKLAVDGVVYGSVNVVGARTMRMSHSNPNTANVDSDAAMRRAWIPTGKLGRSWCKPVLLGVDASGLELRCLANRLWPYDDGAAAKIILEGDIHEHWRQLSGLFTRKVQKTFNYAMLYGAGVDKLAKVVIEDWNKALEEGLTDKPAPDRAMAREYARDARARIMEGMPALAQLLDRIEDAYQRRGWLWGLKDHVIAMESSHGGLNDLLQSDGAIVMKEALMAFWGTARGDFDRGSWAPCGNIHDEWQFEVVNEEVANELGRFATRCIRTAGEMLSFHVELDGEYKIGSNWSETH